MCDGSVTVMLRRSASVEMLQLAHHPPLPLSSVAGGHKRRAAFRMSILRPV